MANGGEKFRAGANVFVGGVETLAAVGFEGKVYTDIASDVLRPVVELITLHGSQALHDGGTVLDQISSTVLNAPGGPVAAVGGGLLGFEGIRRIVVGSRSF